MFKSILRTLPSLSGNFTLACKLANIQKEDTNTYYAFIKYANLMPLQNSINKKDIEVNLLNGKYEYDIQKYFSVYSNVFYKENFNYSTSNYKILDINSQYNETNDNRNKDYEFGCKRVNYSQLGYQYNFYAPIYIDNINDIPEYFCIKINIDNKVQKTIKVYINKDNVANYLKQYLNKYLKNIDDRVIFCLTDSLQASYFGIDVKNGGLVKYRDNIFGSLYTNQTTINNFDNIICKGFERNNLIMRQIIPLSFLFNLDDIFNNYERKFFIGKTINVIGFYYNEYDMKCDLYDFDINYFNSYNQYNKFNELTGKYTLENGYDQYGKTINVCNVDYPALNESKYVKYEFANKITPTYCKFKLLYSSDNDPYITNANFAYSYLQYPNQKYGYFPTSFKGITPKLIYSNNDIKLPLGKNIDNYYKVSKYFANNVEVNNVNYDKYNKLMTNYVSSWFTVYDDFDTAIKNKNNWSDVKYNYTYHKGILYDLNDLDNYHITKFGVFLDFDFEHISKDELNNKYVNAKHVFSTSNVSDININSFNKQYDSGLYDEILNITYNGKTFNNISYNSIDSKSYLHNNVVMIKDKKGLYVKIKDYKKENTYLKFDDVINYINSVKTNKTTDLINLIVSQLNDVKILGYELLPAVNNINFFTSKLDNSGKTKYELITDSLSEITGNSNLVHKLYYSLSTSTKKEKLSLSSSILSYNEDLYEKFYVYLENYFININDIISIILDVFYNKTNFNNFVHSYDISKNIKYKNVYEAANKFIQLQNILISNTENGVVNTENIDRQLVSSISNGYVNIFDALNYYVNRLNLLLEKTDTLQTYNESLIISYLNEYKNKLLNEIYNNIFNSLIIYIKLNIKKYLFEQFNTINGTNISNYFVELEDNINDIYIDAYNLNNLVNKYNNTYTNKITLNDLNLSSHYVKLLNKDHIIEYFYKFLSSEGIYNRNIFQLIFVKTRYWNNDNGQLVPMDMYTTLYNYIMKYQLYVDENNVSSIENDINEIQNIISNNNDIDVFNWLLDNLSYSRNQNNKFTLFISSNIKIEVDLCIKRNVYMLDQNLYKLLLEKDDSINNYLYFYINSDERTENKDAWNIISSNDMTDKTHSVIINSYTYMFTDNLQHINNYLVPLYTNIYVNDNDISVLNDMIKYKKILNYKYIKNTGEYFKEVDIESILNNIYESKAYIITQLYDKLYVNGSSLSLLEKIKILISNNNNEFKNIIRHYFGDSIINTIMMIENDIDNNNEYNNLISIINNESKKNELIDLLRSEKIYQNFIQYLETINTNENKNINIDTDNIQSYIIEFLYNNYIDICYDIIEDNDIDLYSLKNYPLLSLDSFDNNNVIYDDKYKIYIYNDGTNVYGFYYINCHLDNTNLTFNLLNDYGLNVSFEYINGHSVSDIKFIKNIFHILYPFFKLNIFTELTKSISTIIFQNEIELKIMYGKDNIISNNELVLYRDLITSDTDVLYKSLSELANYKKIKLLRYFNYITPLLKKVDNYEETWLLKFMDYDKSYNNIKKHNIIYKSLLNIYKYEPLNVFYHKYNTEKHIFEKSYQINQIEYKHFNDNLLYYLPTEIIVYDSEIYDKTIINDINDNNKEEYFNNKKIDILYNFFKEKGLDCNNIKLFLFNKYNSSFYIEKYKNTMYKIKYIFSLI